MFDTNHPTGTIASGRGSYANDVRNLSTSGGPNISNGKRQLTAAQSRRRMIRQKLAEAAGLVKPGEVFHAYGPNKTAGADKLLQSGTGLGQGLGAAQRDTVQRALMASRRRKGGPAGGKPVV